MIVIPGTSKVAHLRENLAAADLGSPLMLSPSWTASRYDKDRQTPRGSVLGMCTQYSEYIGLCNESASSSADLLSPLKGADTKGSRIVTVCIGTGDDMLAHRVDTLSAESR